MSDALPYGLWPSPITPKFLSQGLRLGDSAWDSDGRTLVWLEGRSDRGVLVAWDAESGQAPRDLTDELSVRARVGYGGGDFCVGSGHLYFVSGGRIYQASLKGGKPKALTPAFGEVASPALSVDGLYIAYVYSYERRDGIAIVPTSGEYWPQIFSCGRDFYMQPRWHPAGSHLAYVAWDHPNMPWDGSELYLAEVGGSARNAPPVMVREKLIAGSKEVAVLQPEFSPDGQYLSYLSDESGFFNLYLYDMKKGASAGCLTREHAAQLGGPTWVQGLRTYGWSHDGKTIYIVRNERGLSTLCAIDVATADLRVLPQLESYTDFVQPAVNPKKPLISMATSAGNQPLRLVSHQPQGSTIIVKRATSENVSAQTLVAPQAIFWKSTDGAEAHGLLYRPRSDRASPGRPPAIIRIHGGPTSQARAAFNADAQFFATRGYAVLDVNYRGSTGYGRAYMNALRGNWGIHDVADAVSGARHIAEEGFADREKLVIMGGSAGGFTVLQALVTHPKFFKAGVCLYGVSNMFTLAADTHKFEERYLDSLLGPLPEAAPVYRQRSPIFHAQQIVDPVAIFQGETDEVVPRAQSDTIVESLKRRGVPHEYHIYPGEGHGWRKSETIERFYTSVEKFLKEYVLFA
ncbi:MAG TPA: S9 family peptidase [Planctomycetota bacterium]|nr:S9 family peptidase [Planctomycetota bacterium]